MIQKHLVLGGARSGKSLYAEKLISCFPPPYIYIATAEVLDDEMADRVRRHRERRGDQWITYEEPLGLVKLLQTLTPTSSPILVDCLTLWLSNLLIAEQDAEGEVERLCGIIRQSTASPLIFVSNEVGLGIVPENDLARRFRDVAGWAHQKIAAECTHVTWMVAGIPVVVKHPEGKPPGQDIFC
ncbi:MAG: bifunctional adenosylcobinamide kinase/adenosylcobinamide-phosphate guanylyltransferase [Thermodesulforhabdaceae bacterium]